MKRGVFLFCGLGALAAIIVSAQTTDTFRVIASTSWTAAIARAAGARDLVTIAPFELQHPPEYEIKPSDLKATAEADFLVYSGYERFASRLAETAGNGGLVIAKVYTDNIPETLKQEAKKLALLFGTERDYEVWAASFDSLTEGMRKRIAAAYPDKRVIAHKYLETFAEWLGFTVVGVFGPGESTPKQLLQLVRAKPSLIIDNYHNPAGAPAAEALDVPLVMLINFPGKDNTKTIEDVFRRNERVFMDAASYDKR